MKYTFMKLMVIWGLMICLPNQAFTQCIGDNTFNGAVDSDWAKPGNWSSNCVPSSPVTGKLTISANCVVTGNSIYTFIEGSILEVPQAISLTNNGSGQWTIQGTLILEGSFTHAALVNAGSIFGNGAFIGNLTGNGTLGVGAPPPSNWNCGDTIYYGGKPYPTVLIGSQCWMAANINLGTMLDGNLECHNNLVIEKYCYNNDTANCNTYGGLYSWMEFMGYTTTNNQGLCPTGWHVPSDQEWKELEGTVDSQYSYPGSVWDQLGFRGYDAGKRLKSTSGWSNNGNGTDNFGFNALPAGMRDHDASGADFFNQGDIAQFWTSSLYFPFVAYAKERQIWGLNTTIYRGNEVSGLGYSIRCLKD